MEAPCLAHKFERLQTTTDGPRPEIRPNLLREGEVSPFKICVTILLREHYSLQQTTERPPAQRIAALRCLHDLVSIPDLTFRQFKQTMLDPEHCLRIEVVQSVLCILQELDRNNIAFLNDFANTMIEISESSSSVVILKKKIGKNGVFGRFVRMVLMSIRKMSYAQTMHTYRELCLYVGLAYKVEEQEQDKAAAVNGDGKLATVIATKEVVTMEQDGEPTTIVQAASVDEECAMLEQTLSDTQISDDEEVTTSSGSDMSVSVSQLETPPPSKLVFPSASTSSVGLGAEVEVKTILSTPASITKPIGFIFDRMEKMVPYDASLTFNAQTLAAPMPNKDTPPKHGLDAFEEMRKARIERNAGGLGTSLNSNFAQRLERLKNTPQIEDGQDRLQRSIYNDATAMDVDQPPESGNGGEGGPGPRRNGVGIGGNGIASNNPKLWSRKLIESTIKMVTRDMEYDLEPRKYSARQVSTFVEHAKTNPSAKVLLPQLHFMDYMSSLELKDISRAHEALRTSFDLRIKPTTSELSKAIPYASYNFAVLYDRLGYKKDAKMFLEEAFQSGHSSADETCLEYCHNLWSHFEGVGHKDPFTVGTGAGASTASGKETGKGIANLQTIRAIAGVMERLRTGGSSQLELLNDLYKCAPTGAVVEAAEVMNGEALIMEALISILMTFGWYHWARLTCNSALELAEDFGWPASTFCSALCALGHINLLEGRTRAGRKLFEYGAHVFGPQTNPVGETFNKQHALFQAVRLYLGGEPLNDDLLATLAAFDPVESLYWLGYTKMLQCDFDGALSTLRQLSRTLDDAKIHAVDLKIRCLLLQGELYCLTGAPTTALPFQYDALELATLLNSDYYMILAKINLACVQHALGLYNEAARTLLPLPVSHLLSASSCRYLRARLHILNVKLFLGMEVHDPLDLHSDNNQLLDPDKPLGPNMLTFIMRTAPKTEAGAAGRRSSFRRPSTSAGAGGAVGVSAGPSSPRSVRRKEKEPQARPAPAKSQPQKPSTSKQQPDDVQRFRDRMASCVMGALREADYIFRHWPPNSYRKKEGLYLRRQLLLELQPHRVDDIRRLQAEFEALDTYVMWDPKTCVM